MDSITARLIESKLEYGGLGKVDIAGTEFFYRLLTVREYQVIVESESLDQTELEETICHWCLIQPTYVDWDAYPAMTATMLAQVIVEESRFDSPEDLLDRMQRARDSFQKNIPALIIVKLCSTVPGYTPMQLRDFTLPQLLDELAAAEEIVGKQIISEQLFRAQGRGMQPPDIPNPMPPRRVMGSKWTQTPEQQTEESAISSDQALAEVMAGKREATPIPGFND
jgi:hypothetical protein